MQKSISFFKRFALVFLSMMLISCNTCVSAAVADDDDSIAVPFYTTIDTNSAYILINGIKATCNVTVTSRITTSLYIKMELQKEKSSGYETVETWTKSKYGPGMSYTESRYINIFSSYRLKATITAGSETIVVYDYPK